MKIIIEVQKICSNTNNCNSMDDEKAVLEEYEHVGYIKMIFKYTYEAKKYVKKQSIKKASVKKQSKKNKVKKQSKKKQSKKTK